MTEPLTCPGFPGWDHILARLSARMAELGYRDYPPKADEKWGHLRIDYGGATWDIHDAVEAAEEESERTCGRCGKPGRTRSFDGWLRTLCDGCVPVSERV